MPEAIVGALIAIAGMHVGFVAARAGESKRRQTKPSDDLPYVSFGEAPPEGYGGL